MTYWTVTAFGERGAHNIQAATTPPMSRTPTTTMPAIG